MHITFIFFLIATWLFRMVEHIVGEKVFKQAFCQFLKQNKFGFFSDNLWEIMTELAHESKTIPTDLTVSTIIDTWLLSAGYPTLFVDRDKSNGTIIIRQVCKLFYLFINALLSDIFNCS